MTTFDNREQSFERKFAHDEELRFKATVRRNKLLGQWAASELGLSGSDADAYAKDVIASDFEEVGDQDVVRKIMRDFEAKKVDVSQHRVERHLQEFMEEAKRQIMEESE